jgi:hypothetical protein
MTRLSAQLGLHVVVEGVETQEQLELLTGDNSIDEVQGYLLGRPIRHPTYVSCFTVVVLRLLIRRHGLHPFDKTWRETKVLPQLRLLADLPYSLAKLVLALRNC